MLIRFSSNLLLISRDIYWWSHNKYDAQRFKIGEILGLKNYSNANEGNGRQKNEIKMDLAEEQVRRIELYTDLTFPERLHAQKMSCRVTLISLDY